MRALAILILLAAALSPSLVASELEAAYTAWNQGRPAEALPALQDAAAAEGSWDRWYDLGLAALAAERHGQAAAALIQAHRLAPDRGQPLQALAQIGNQLPPPLSRQLGPLAWPGQGPLAPWFLALGGAALAWALIGTRHRRWAGLAATALLLISLPGHLARWWDQRVPYLAVAEDSLLLDATGHPLAQAGLPAGSVVVAADQDPWNGRHLVTTLDGRRGWVPLADLVMPSD